MPSRPGTDRELMALCLEIHDLVLAKCAAGRERDWDFAREALSAGLVAAGELLGRIDDMPIHERQRTHIRSMLRGIVVNMGED